MASQKCFYFGRAGTLFSRKTIKRELTKVVFEPTEQQHKAAKDWAKQVHHTNFRKAKETSVRGEFIQTVLVALLGYTPYRAGEIYTIATEEAQRRRGYRARDVLRQRKDHSRALRIEGAEDA